MTKSNKKVMIVGGVLLLGVIFFSIYQVGGITQKKRDEKRIGSGRGSGNEGDMEGQSINRYAIIHKAPEQERIDLIKKVKTYLKINREKMK